MTLYRVPIVWASGGKFFFKVWSLIKRMTQIYVFFENIKTLNPSSNCARSYTASQIWPRVNIFGRSPTKSGRGLKKNILHAIGQFQLRSPRSNMDMAGAGWTWPLVARFGCYFKFGPSRLKGVEGHFIFIFSTNLGYLDLS